MDYTECRKIVGKYEMLCQPPRFYHARRVGHMLRDERQGAHRYSHGGRGDHVIGGALYNDRNLLFALDHWKDQRLGSVLFGWKSSTVFVSVSTKYCTININYCCTKYCTINMNVYVCQKCLCFEVQYVLYADLL
jgi:hypothetical protein